MITILGIDPGLQGGLAVVTRDGDDGRIRLVEAIDVPTEGTDAAREVSPSVLTFIQKHRPAAAYMERAQAMPDQGASSGFIYGAAYGALRLAVRGCLVPLTRIESRAWKRAHGLPTGSEKEHSRQIAIHLFPEGWGYFERVRDHNRAEAALIAYYGVMLAHSRAVPETPAPAARNVQNRRRGRGQGTIVPPSREAARIIREIEASRRVEVANPPPRTIVDVTPRIINPPDAHRIRPMMAEEISQDLRLQDVSATDDQYMIDPHSVPEDESSDEPQETGLNRRPPGGVPGSNNAIASG